MSQEMLYYGLFNIPREDFEKMVQEVLMLFKR
jgi:hypothetical protein